MFSENLFFLTGGNDCFDIRFITINTPLISGVFFWHEQKYKHKYHKLTRGFYFEKTHKLKLLIRIFIICFLKMYLFFLISFKKTKNLQFYLKLITIIDLLDRYHDFFHGYFLFFSLFYFI